MPPVRLPGVKSNAPSIKTCQYCDATFKKREHVVRHERGHTKEQPYPCNVCGKLFARQDSLLRHVRTHTGAEAGGSAVSPAPQQPQLPLPLPTPAHVSVPQHSPLDYCPHVSLPQLSPDHAHDPYLSPSHHAISNPALTAIDLFVEAAGMLRDSEEAGKMNVEKTSLQDDVWSPDFFSSYAQTPSHLPSFPSINQLSPADPDALLNLFTHGDLPFAEHWMLDLAMPMQSSDWNVSLPQAASRITSRAVSMSPGPRQTPSVDSPLSEIDRNHAIRETFSLIAEVSSSFDANAKSISAAFLNDSLQLFWERVAPHFPIMHRPTFDPRETIPPLLLNQIALGSLFHESKLARAKGETLWLLSHKGVAAAWDKLIEYRGPHAETRGVQLVLTALFGQIYASLSSNQLLRATSRTFHSLGFRWGYEAKMYDRSPTPPLDPLATPEELNLAWRRWAASEVQLRALLGHYVMDGRLSAIGHLPPCARHTSNPTGSCSSLLLFQAPTAEAWAAIRLSEATLPPPPIFRDVFSTLFSNSPEPALTSYPFPLLSLYTILEGLQSLVSDLQCSGGKATVGVPSSPSISLSLTRFLSMIHHSTILTPSNRNDLLVRYHAISITLFTHVPALLSLSTPRHEWASTPAGRRTMLHAAAIRSLAEARAGGSAGPFHLPSAVYLAAVITHAFLEGTKGVVGSELRFEVASPVDWEQLGGEGESVASRFVRSGGQAFLEGRPLSSLSLHLLASLLRRLGHFWGTASEWAEDVSGLLDA